MANQPLLFKKNCENCGTDFMGKIKQRFHSRRCASLKREELRILRQQKPTGHLLVDGKPTSKSVLLALLRKYGTVSMGLIADLYPQYVYSARSRICEIKQDVISEGLTITHKYGDTWRKNSYTLTPIHSEAPTPEPLRVDVVDGQRVFA